MKTSSSDLHSLVHSLTTREKSFIVTKLRHNRDDSYKLKLFSLVNKQKTFNENKLYVKLRSELTPKKFIDVKNRLSYTILSLLENYHAQDKVNYILQSSLRQAEILQSKELYKMAGKILHKAQKLAMEQEKFEYLMLIRRMIVFGYRMNRDLEKLEDHIHNKEYKRQDEIIENIRNEEEYRRLMIRTELLLSKGHSIVHYRSTKRDLETLAASGYLTDPVNAKTILGKLYFHYVLASIATLQGKGKKALATRMAWLNYLKNKATGWEVFNKEYLTTLANISASGIAGKGMELYKRANKFFFAIPSKKRAGLEMIQIHHLSNIISNVQPIEAVELYKDAISIIEKKIDHSTRILFYINMTMVFCQISDFHSAIRLLNKIINYKGMERKNDVQILARIFCLICHYELENYDLLLSLHNSFFRWMIRNHPLFKVEIEIISMFKKIPLKSESKEQKKQFFVDMLNVLKNQASGKPGLIGSDKFFNIWHESKIEDRPFAEVLKEKAKNS
ncbi:MAG: hypothetical protein HYU69_11695 [Bacteroidetes bacterium]|nr:hypothetical protein [Bacteroidota bacterium]